MQPQPQTPINEQWGRDFFRMVDRKNAQEYTTYFTEDGQVVFGNNPPIIGKDNIERGMAQFYGTITSMRHDIEQLWVPAPDTIVNQAVAVYGLPDGSQVRLPVVTVINLTGEKVRKVQFYLDMTPLQGK